jgi:hypothetical protein
MAITHNISNLNNKIENEGTTNQGRLTADEWNKLVSAVGEVQTKVEGTIKGIKYNGGAEEGGQTFTEIDEQGYLKMFVATNNSDYTLTPYVTEPDKIVANNSTCPVQVYVSSKKGTGEDKAPAELATTVSIYINEILVHTAQVWDQDYGKQDSVWYDPLKNTVLNYDLFSAKNTSLLVDRQGENITNSIKIQFNNGFGTVEYKYFTVSVIELGLVVNSFNASTNVFTENKLPNLIVTVTGTNADVYAKVDGETMIVDKYAANAGERTNIGSDCFKNVNTHGVHTIEIWASVTKVVGGTTYEIKTARQSFTYIYGTTDTKPIVMSTISNFTPEAYSTLDVSYIAYKYNETSSIEKDTVFIELCKFDGYDSDNNPIGLETIGEKISNEITFDVSTKSGSGSTKVSLFPIDNNQESIIGKKLIKLSIGDFVQYTEIEVLRSTVTLIQATGYAVYLSAANKNNAQPNKNEWISTGIDSNNKPLTTTVTFDDNIEFLPTGSGWNSDTNGNIALNLKKGKYATLNYQPFSTNPTYKVESNGSITNGTGKTISFEIATRNCLKNDSPVISCLDDSNGTERGFVITASSAILKSNNFGLQAKFRENTRIKIDFVIEGEQIPYKYTTIAGKDATEDDWEKDKESPEALCIIYVDGVYQCLTVIPESTTFLQGRSGVPAPFIKFGSEDCDLDIYNVRIYDYALTPTQIVNNYSYDTPNFEDKIAIAKRNDIFDNTGLGNKPNINIGKLSKARPELPFWYVKIDTNKHEEIMPYDKTNWLNMSMTKWINPMNQNKPTEGAVSFTAGGGQFRNQGTSSMTYPWPWRNWDWKLKSGVFNFGDGTTGEKWCQYLGMDDTENISKITLKKDYASSEMCNNAITSEYFTDMAIGIGSTSGFEGVLSPAQRNNQEGVKTPFRLTFKAIPCFMFQELNDSTQPGTAGLGYEALGMMNLIPNKNECGYLGFMGQYTWKENNSQSWELADNMDQWFWYKKLEGIKNDTITDENGNQVDVIINDVIECYEARYPKDSTLNKDKSGNYSWNSDKDEADFGSVPKGYTKVTDAQIAAINNEQADIISFHNWLVDCNRQIPKDYFAKNGKYEKLSTAVVINDVEYDEDTPAYRLAKFIQEAPQRLHIDQFCLYYIWRETFWAFDSGFKNLQVYTMGNADGADFKQWGCMVRDADTTLGIQNQGKDIFPPHLEDIDYYTADVDAEGNAVNNVRFVYGGARNLYHADSIAEQGGYPVLNGQLGSLWINLRDGFPSRIAEIYRELKNNKNTNWNASAAIKRFRDHQEKWCESLYNFGMRQYFGGDPFVKWINSGLGDKKNSRASWLDRAFYYRDSKYNCLSDYCCFRAVCYETPDLEGETTVNTPLKLKAYIPMYFAAGATEAVMASCPADKIRRITNTNDTFDVLPVAGFGFSDGLAADQNRWFFGTNQLTEIGDLARSIKLKEIQTLNLPKVREFSIGHEKDRTNGVPYKEYYVDNNEKLEREIINTSLEGFDCSSLKQLTILDITNHKALKSNAFTGLEQCTQLQELYARGTDSLTTIKLPATTSLRVLYLGKSLTNINLENLTGIEKFVLEGANNIEQLYIRNCGSYMATESYNIVKSALSALERSYDVETNNNVCILDGINWMDADITYIERLLNIKATLSGKIHIKYGKLTNDLKVRLVAEYGNIDSETNGLYITYDKLGIDNISVQAKMYLYTLGKHELSFISSPTGANTFSNAVWSITDFVGGSADDYASVVYENNKWYLNVKQTADDTVYAKLKVTVNQIGGYPSKTAESTVYFYERLAKPGDIVFNDGTFSDVLEAGKTPIGVCFYVDPNNSNNRLMCALSDVLNGTNGWAWGLCPVSSTSNTVAYSGSAEGINFNATWDENLVINGTDKNKDVKCFDIEKLLNSNSYTFEPNVNPNSNWCTDSYYRSTTTVDKFKDFQSYTNVLGSIGWVTVGVSYGSGINFNTITDGINKDDNGDYREPVITINTDDSIPIGYYNTMAMIEHRNKLLTAYHWSNYGFDNENPDGQNDGNRTRFAIPKEYPASSEINELKYLMNSAKSWNYADRTVSANRGNTGADLFYYPAASACYAYEPLVDNLNDKFKKHNWFLPSSGEMYRILYYYKWYDNTNTTEFEDLNAFKYVLTTNFNGNMILSNISSSTAAYVTSTEHTESMAIAAKLEGIETGKYSNKNVRPICRF